MVMTEPYDCVISFLVFKMTFEPGRGVVDGGMWTTITFEQKVLARAEYNYMAEKRLYHHGR